jgi:hypothetical protein
MKTTKQVSYVGRRALLKEIRSKSESTKRYLLDHLKMDLSRSGNRKPFRQLAKRLGVRIKKLELA